MATSDTKAADTDEKIFIGKGEQTAWLALALANRHGLVTGATGTGKTVTLQVMAEGFAHAGVPVFAADIKGDLSGISEVGEGKDFILKRAREIGLVHAVVPERDLDSTIEAYASELLTSAPGAITGAKRLIAAVADRLPVEVADLTAETIARHRVSDEGQDGMRAFLEKRKPGWIS